MHIFFLATHPALIVFVTHGGKGNSIFIICLFWAPIRALRAHCRSALFYRCYAALQKKELRHQGGGGHSGHRGATHACKLFMAARTNISLKLVVLVKFQMKFVSGS